MNKVTQILLAIFFASGFFTATQAQTDSKTDLFIRNAFSCLKTKDSIKFKTLFPNYKIFLEIMGKMIQAKNQPDSLMLSDQAKLAEMFSSDGYENELSTKELKKFFRMISIAEDAAVVWPNAKYVSYSIDKTEVLTAEIQELKGAIFFTSCNSSYKILFNNTIRYNSDLYGIRFRRIYKLVNDKYVDDQGNEEGIRKLEQ